MAGKGGDVTVSDGRRGSRSSDILVGDHDVHDVAGEEEDDMSAYINGLLDDDEGDNDGSVRNNEAEEGGNAREADHEQANSGLDSSPEKQELGDHSWPDVGMQVDNVQGAASGGGEDEDRSSEALFGGLDDDEEEEEPNFTGSADDPARSRPAWEGGKDDATGSVPLPERVTNGLQLPSMVVAVASPTRGPLSVQQTITGGDTSQTSASTSRPPDEHSRQQASVHARSGSEDGNTASHPIAAEGVDRKPTAPASGQAQAQESVAGQATGAHTAPDARAFEPEHHQQQSAVASGSSSDHSPTSSASSLSTFEALASTSDRPQHSPNKRQSPVRTLAQIPEEDTASTVAQDAASHGAAQLNTQHHAAAHANTAPAAQNERTGGPAAKSTGQAIPRQHAAEQEGQDRVSSSSESPPPHLDWRKQIYALQIPSLLLINAELVRLCLMQQDYFKKAFPNQQEFSIDDNYREIVKRISSNLGYLAVLTGSTAHNGVPPLPVLDPPTGASDHLKSLYAQLKGYFAISQRSLSNSVPVSLAISAGFKSASQGPDNNNDQSQHKPLVDTLHDKPGNSNAPALKRELDNDMASSGTGDPEAGPSSRRQKREKLDSSGEHPSRGKDERDGVVSRPGTATSTGQVSATAPTPGTPLGSQRSQSRQKMRRTSNESHPSTGASRVPTPKLSSAMQKGQAPSSAMGQEGSSQYAPQGQFVNNDAVHGVQPIGAGLRTANPTQQGATPNNPRFGQVSGPNPPAYNVPDTFPAHMQPAQSAPESPHSGIPPQQVQGPLTGGTAGGLPPATPQQHTSFAPQTAHGQMQHHQQQPSAPGQQVYSGQGPSAQMAYNQGNTQSQQTNSQSPSNPGQMQMAQMGGSRPTINVDTLAAEIVHTQTTLTSARQVQDNQEIFNKLPPDAKNQLLAKIHEQENRLDQLRRIYNQATRGGPAAMAPQYAQQASSPPAQTPSSVSGPAQQQQRQAQQQAAALSTPSQRPLDFPSHPQHTQYHSGSDQPLQPIPYQRGPMAAGQNSGQSPAALQQHQPHAQQHQSQQQQLQQQDQQHRQHGNASSPSQIHAPSPGQSVQNVSQQATHGYSTQRPPTRQATAPLDSQQSDRQHSQTPVHMQHLQQANDVHPSLAQQGMYTHQGPFHPAQMQPPTRNGSLQMGPPPQHSTGGNSSTGQGQRSLQSQTEMPPPRPPSVMRLHGNLQHQQQRQQSVGSVGPGTPSQAQHGFRAPSAASYHSIPDNVQQPPNAASPMSHASPAFTAPSPAQSSASIPVAQHTPQQQVPPIHTQLIRQNQFAGVGTGQSPQQQQTPLTPQQQQQQQFAYAQQQQQQNAQMQQRNRMASMGAGPPLNAGSPSTPLTPAQQHHPHSQNGSPAPQQHHHQPPVHTTHPNAAAEQEGSRAGSQTLNAGQASNARFTPVASIPPPPLSQQQPYPMQPPFAQGPSGLTPQQMYALQQAQNRQAMAGMPHNNGPMAYTGQPMPSAAPGLTPQQIAWLRQQQQQQQQQQQRQQQQQLGSNSAGSPQDGGQDYMMAAARQQAQLKMQTSAGQQPQHLPAQQGMALGPGFNGMSGPNLGTYGPQGSQPQQPFGGFSAAAAAQGGFAGSATGASNPGMQQGSIGGNRGMFPFAQTPGGMAGPAGYQNPAFAGYPMQQQQQQMRRPGSPPAGTEPPNSAASVDFDAYLNVS